MHLILCFLFLSSSSVSLFGFLVFTICLYPPFFRCWPSFSLVKHPRASSCLWTSVNWMLVLGRVQTSSSWCPLSPFATKSIPRARFSTYPSALSWTSSLRLSLSLRASWRPPVRDSSFKLLFPSLFGPLCFYTFCHPLLSNSHTFFSSPNSSHSQSKCKFMLISSHITVLSNRYS